MNYDLILRYKTSLIFFVVGIFLFVLAYAVSVSDRKVPAGSNAIEINDQSLSTTSSTGYFVDIQGAVIAPGVYEFEKGSRVGEVIARAGGMSRQADADWVAKHINQAEEIRDGAKIYIPFINNQLNEGNPSYKSDFVNINTASTAELETLSGIGEKRAVDIVNGRPYSSIDDLLYKEVISVSIFESIRDFITAYD